MKRRLFILSALWPSLVFAHSSKIGSIAIGHSWALPSSGPEAQVMMPLVNMGELEDALMGATSSLAAKIELRSASLQVLNFKLQPKKPFPMRAAAFHLQLLGLTKPLEVGDIFPITLTFMTAGQIEIQIHVAEKPGE